MSFNAGKIKSFILGAFRGGKRSKIGSQENDVRWQAVLEDDDENDSDNVPGENSVEERRSPEPIASFPDKLSEDDVKDGDNVHITRASVYSDGDGAVVDAVKTSAKPKSRRRCEEKSASDMERGARLCHGPDLTPIRGTSPLSTFAHDVERELTRSGRAEPFESGNSLDIERELNELLGALRLGTDGDGSEVNLAYVRSELEDEEEKMPGGERPGGEQYWREQRVKSKSFAERCRLFRGGRNRMSMFEFGGRTVKQAFEVPTRPRFFRLSEGRIGSVASLPAPPTSADGKVFVGAEPDSARTSKCYEEDIDWSWLEEATKALNEEEEQPETRLVEGHSSRVDAGCQTHSEQSWHGGGEDDDEEGGGGADAERERMRDSPSPSTDSAVTSERRAVPEIVVPCNEEDMSGKGIVVERGSGPSGVSTWLRQSMRRVRHFNLGEPPRIRSAPPDGLRGSDTVGSDESGSESRVIGSGNGQQGQTQQQGNGSRGREHGGRNSSSNGNGRRTQSRTRPTSLPARRPVSVTAPLQSEPGSGSVQSSGTSPSEAQENLGYESDSTDRHPSPRRRSRRRRGDQEDDGGGVGDDYEGRSPLGPWPHGLSSVLAGLGCTLGLFNISRFAILSVHFGSNFILQFLILSLILGVPLLAFHAALGQTLGAGPVDMWKISPLFQGIGIAVLLSQALIGVYSVVGVSWMFVYFRDSFITKQDTFRWAESFRHYREDHIFATTGPNTSGRLDETVPDYLNGVVLQRHVLGSPDNAFGHLKFQLTFNLAVVWMIVFVSLSKGLRSYGKVVYVFSLVPVLGILVMSSKLLGLTPLHRGLFPQTDWSEFFLNDQSWISAATEVTLTWNLLGAATMQVTSHNRTRKRLWRDVATISLLTLMVLILAAFLGNTCHQILSLRGYSYVPSSFERMSTYSFLRHTGPNLPPLYAMPVRHMPHASLVAGDRVGKPGGIQESGYQVIRLATELVPATLALLGGDYLSPFWAVLFYFTLILFGIAQQLAIWHCVITGIMAINAPSLKSWETTITFFTCAAGFVLGLPMTTEFGVFVVYFLDYCVGGGWWILLLTIVEICAVLMIRGRPYTGENISIALFGKSTNCISLWAIPMLTFGWNVIVPVSLLIICITIFKTGGYRDLWMWKCGKADYWPLWTREVGVFVQVIPLACIPLVALIQIYRYLTTGPLDIFDRIANLYRPNTDIHGVLHEDNMGTSTGGAPPTTSPTSGNAELTPTEDPPPKYTPPPSYSTATGARIAKMLRQSFRRSVRRIQSVLGPEVQAPSRPPPPDYASVLVEMNESRSGGVHTPEAHNFTAADVVQVLRCSFRRTDTINRADTSQTTTNAPNPATSPQTLVIPPQWNQ